MGDFSAHLSGTPLIRGAKCALVVGHISCPAGWPSRSVKLCFSEKRELRANPWISQSRGISKTGYAARRYNRQQSHAKGHLIGTAAKPRGEPRDKIGKKPGPPNGWRTKNTPPKRRDAALRLPCPRAPPEAGRRLTATDPGPA